MAMTTKLLEASIRRFHRLLEDNRDVLDALNVYPVPDGDTGTNLALTAGAVIHAMDTDGHGVLEAMTRGSLMGARGNSGVILSQVLQGIADVLGESEEVSTASVASALRAASDGAYGAVQWPVEGTILTVLREAAEEAEAGAASERPVELMIEEVYRRACDALARTPDMLSVLAEAGVVDAGGAGATLLIAALAETFGTDRVDLPEVMFRYGSAHRTAHEPGASSRYEVMFLLESTDEVVEEFRSEWSTVGDSIVVVGSGGTWSCHIHTDHIGPAIEAGIRYGRPSEIRVTDLDQQVATAEFHPEKGVPAFEPVLAVRRATFGVVAVVAGDGLVEVFRSLGVQGVVTGGQSANPSAAELLSTIEEVPADTVVVLPNNRNVIPVAEQLDGLTTKRVAVVPTRTIPQGIAAMFGYDPSSSDHESTVDDMAAAASSVITGEMTMAVRQASVAFGEIAIGDWLGIADGTIVVADPDLESALRGLVAAILPVGAELLTLYTGVGAPKSASKALVAWLGELHPQLDIVEVHGGQPLYPYLVSVE